MLQKPLLTTFFATRNRKSAILRHLLLAGVIVALILTGCGQKGPLYLPTPEQEKKQEKH